MIEIGTIIHIEDRKFVVISCNGPTLESVEHTTNEWSMKTQVAPFINLRLQEIVDE